MTTIEIKRYEELQPAAIRAVLKNHAGEKGSLLPILHDVQQQLGYIPPSSVPVIAEAVNLSRAEVHGVISYYHDFHTEPQPRHRVQVCRAEACQARGGEDLLKHAKNSLGCNSKGVSRDGQGFYVDSLTEGLREFGVELHHTYAGCEECLLGLMKGSFDLAGIHVPADDMCDPITSAYQEHLDGMDLALIEVGTQRLGFMVAPWNPKNIFSIADLTRPEVRFVNRQEGSGTRTLLDCLLCHQSVEPEMVAGFRDIEFTHEAVAAYVASGVADVGFGLETVAKSFRLDFVPITNERYFFVCRHETLVSPEVDAMRVILRTLGHSATAQILPTDVGLEALAEVFGLVSNHSP